MGACFSAEPAKAAPSASRAAPAPASAAPASEPVLVASAPPPPVRRPAPVTDLNRAMLTLKSNRDRVQLALGSAERQCDADLVKAVELKQDGHLDRAVFVMKRRRLTQRRADDAMRQLQNLEAMIGTVETQEDTGLLLEAMKESNAALKSFQEICNLDTIAAAQKDWAEHAERRKQVQDALDSAIDCGFVMPSDEEINAEIAASLAGRGDAVEGEPEGEAKVVPTAVPSVLTTQQVLDKVAAAGETPDVMPEMPFAPTEADGEEEERVAAARAPKARQAALA
jgi:charged multivesicular body protein 6